ncbi:MAG: NUDIX hydrolase [Desulfurococcales archaeon ex4484_204]|nr:MAG: NUDIX hydrolase [Desulfurococcales archaeon ex4484_204]
MGRVGVGVRVISEEVLCEGKRVRLIQKRMVINGREVVRDVVDFGEAVAIVPVLDDGRVVMLRQYRAPVNEWVYEVPAGRVEPGEDVIDAARRELIEETGYEASDIRRVVSIYTAPGYSNEVLHICIARGLTYVGARPEPGELIEIVELPLMDAIAKVLRCRVSDAKTLISLMLYRYVGEQEG